MVGHGSSDNAASYGVYAFGLLPAWTALRDSISLSVYYGAEIDLRGSCIVALSQSGETPDVLDYVERPRARRASRSRSRTTRLGARASGRARAAARAGESARSPRRRRTRPRLRRSRSSPRTRAGRDEIAEGSARVAPQLDDACRARAAARRARGRASRSSAACS
jgi:hypothetical protein